MVFPIPLNKASSSADCVILASSRSEKELPIEGDVSEPEGRRARCGGERGFDGLGWGWDRGRVDDDDCGGGGGKGCWRAVVVLGLILGLGLVDL